MYQFPPKFGSFHCLVPYLSYPKEDLDSGIKRHDVSAFPCFPQLTFCAVYMCINACAGSICSSEILSSEKKKRILTLATVGFTWGFLHCSCTSKSSSKLERDVNIASCLQNYAALINL